MIVTIQRVSSTAALTIANGAALSDILDVRGSAGGIVSMPAAWTAASLAFYHSPTANGTFQPLKDATGTLVEMTVAASGDFVMPDGVFACQFVKLWSETGGASANQGADRSLLVSLKG